MKLTETLSIFAVCAPGIEPVLERELRQLFAESPVLASIKKEEGGISFRGNFADVQLANLWLRTASRVLIRVASFVAGGFDQFRQKFGLVPWERYVLPEIPLQFRISSYKSQLYHTEAIAERAQESIEKRTGVPVLRFHGSDEDAETPQRIIIRFFKDRCTVSLDSSGDNLYRRGYRLAVAKAPLRETFAAAMLLASGWDGQSPFLDPFCGSGAIPIEAGLIAGNIAPGSFRKFSFESWETFVDDDWQQIRSTAETLRREIVAPIAGADRDAGAVQYSIENAERAGLADAVTFSCRAVTDNKRFGDSPGWIVTNPPYGTRIRHNRDLRNLFAAFGNLCRESFPGWRCGFLCTEEELVRQTRLKMEPKLAFSNGGISVEFLVTK